MRNAMSPCRQRRRALIIGILARIERPPHRIFPDAVQTGRHHVVHDVVALGTLWKDLVDQPLLFLLVDLAKP